MATRLFQQWAPREAWGPPRAMETITPQGGVASRARGEEMLCADSGASRVPLAVFRWQETKEAGCGLLARGGSASGPQVPVWAPRAWSSLGRANSDG